MLMRMAQQGKQASRRMRIPLWRITPTRFKFPLPYVCRKTGRKNAEVDPHSSKQRPESASQTGAKCYGWFISSRIPSGNRARDCFCSRAAAKFLPADAPARLEVRGRTS